MRRTIPSLILSAALALGSSAAFAEAFVGQITKIDRSGKSIEVRGEESQRRQRFFLSRRGEVTRDGQPVAFADLKRGDRVAVDPVKPGSKTAFRIAVLDEDASGAVGMRE